MSQVTIEQINKAVEKINSLEPEALNKIAETYTLAQTEMLAYVMEAAEEFDQDILADYVIYYFCIISEMFVQAGLKTSRVTDNMIQEFHEPFIALLEEYAEAADPSILDVLINQPNITTFIAEDLNAEDETGEVLDAELASQLFIVLLASVGLFNQSIE